MLAAECAASGGDVFCFDRLPGLVLIVLVELACVWTKRSRPFTESQTAKWHLLAAVAGGSLTWQLGSLLSRQATFN